MFENRKKNKIRMENCVIVEEEIKMPFEQSVGIMIGEIAMMNPENTTRALSGMAKTDCIFLLLNREAFDILVKEKEKKENEALTQFIFDCVPKMREQF
jgi:CRP-like cAMP-binding protein